MPINHNLPKSFSLLPIHRLDRRKRYDVNMSLKRRLFRSQGQNKPSKEELKHILIIDELRKRKVKVQKQGKTHIIEGNLRVQVNIEPEYHDILSHPEEE